MADRILAVGAHPDDVEFGCAALLIKEVRKGGAVKILVLSKGEAGSNGTPAEREQESRRAAELIGAEIDFLDFGGDCGGDCHIECTPAATIRIAREIREYRPDIVLAPHTGENQHPDHYRVGALTRDAARFARFGGLSELKPLPAHTIRNLYYYAITQEIGLNPQILIDISDALPLWEQAMRCHQSQAKTSGYVEMRMAATRSWGLQTGVEYAMGLYLNDPILLPDVSSLKLSSRKY